MSRRSRLLSLLGAGGLSGLLLFFSDHPVHAWPLQGVALVPWLCALVAWRPRWSAAAGSGAILGLAYTVPLAWLLDFGALLGGGLALYLTLWWVALGVGGTWLLRGPPITGALAVAALAVILEWIQAALLPVWGTAQSFVRVWSAWPEAIQMVSVTGMGGLVFLVVGAGALVAVLILRPGARRRAALALVILLGLAAAASAALWPREPVGRLRVAAVGWIPAQPRRAYPDLFRDTYLPLVREAAHRGARLVVSPEAAFPVPGFAVGPFRDRVSETARRFGVSLVVGYFDLERRENRALLVDRLGRRRGEYVKTHLIPTLERYRPGTGTLVTASLEPAPAGPWAGGAVRLGMMICQDDNFTDLSRGYGRQRVHLVAVPTNDWRNVYRYHLENSLFRAVESRYGLVRAATEGTSVIATARGEVLARADHFQQGAKAIVADLPLYPPGSLYSRLGDWPAALSGAFLLGLLGGWLRRRRRRRGSSPPSPPPDAGG